MGKKNYDITIVNMNLQMPDEKKEKNNSDNVSDSSFNRIITSDNLWKIFCIISILWGQIFIISSRFIFEKIFNFYLIQFIMFIY